METNLNSGKHGIQEYLSIGYLYLLVLGVIGDSIYYSFFDINIIRYSTVLDVLLSPIANLSDNWIEPVFIALMFFIGYWLSIIGPKFHKKYREKKWYQKLENVEKLDKKYAKPQTIDNILFFSAVVIFSFYVGTGFGGGLKDSEKLKTGDFKLDHKLIFTDKEELEVKVYGQNSLYIIYGLKGSKQLSISPIQDNIKKIIIIPKEK